MSEFSRAGLAAVIHEWLEEWGDAGCEMHGDPTRLADCEDLAQRILDEAS